MLKNRKQSQYILKNPLYAQRKFFNTISIKKISINKLFEVNIINNISLKLAYPFTFTFIFIFIIIINSARTTMQPPQSNNKGQPNNTIEEQKQKKNKYQFDLERGRYLRIQSDFDNGNIGLIRQVTELQYRLQAVSDYKTSTSTSQPKKTWFHFKVSAPKGIRVRFIIENVSIYENMYEKDKDWARPVMNDGTGWKQIKDCFLTYRGEVGIIIDYTFSHENFVFFAMAVPHTYQQSESYLRELAFRIPEHIQYEDLIIGKSLGGLNLHLLKLTAKQGKNKQGNSSSGNLLTVKSSIGENKTSVRVHSQANIQSAIVSNISSPKKPIIFITSRVHPGEVGSSHCLIGIIDFLTRSCSLQAFLILKMFEIIIIPIVNPDGVFEGNYRMDLNNINLNRVYLEPSPDLHPTVFKIKQIVNSLINVNIANLKEKIDKQMSLISRKIMFHFDLHSHSSLKPAFIYGNAFDQIVTQTQSELYCKILQQNSEVFKYDLSQFGEKHMKMKDKGEAMTKQGCARVVISKMANVVYSYTVQTAIFPYLNKQVLQPVSNQQFKLIDKFHYEQTKIEQLISRYNIKNQVFIDNMLLGHSIMISILDILMKNPFTRIQNLQESLENYRRQISQNLLQNQERFKLLDIKAYQKVRNIIKCCRQQFTVKNQKQWPHLAVDKIFSNANWPDCFKMYEQGTYIPQQICKKRNRNKTQISESQRQINDFINPKNIRRKYLNIETELTKHNQTQLKRNEVSPSRSLISPRNMKLQMEILPSSNTNTGSILPEIKMNQRISLHKNKINSHSLNKYQATAEQIQQKNQETKQKQVKQLKDMKQIKQLKQLQQKESTKNIVLSFIHQEIEKINVIRKNVQKSMAVQNRLASYKLIKKNSKSPKGMSSMASVNLPNRYGIIIGSNNISGVPSNNPSIQNSQVLSNSKSNKMLLSNLKTCEQIIKQRKNNSIQEDEEQNQYEQQQGIYYVQNTKMEQKEMDKKKDQDYQGHKNRKGNKLPSTSLQRVAFPIFVMQKELPSTITSKRQLAKVKYSEIKKKNIIRQDLCNNSLKLPQLRGIATINQTLNPGSNQNHEKECLKPPKNAQNGLSINVNLNVNLNVCIGNNQKQQSGRARAATMPDQC